MTVRTLSRIRPLLHELLEVLVSIIQPLQQPSTRPPELLFPPPPQHPQFQQNLAHVALLRQLLDPDLIQQEIDHGLFEEAFMIFKKYEQHALAINVLVEHIVSIDRGLEYATKINKPEVWSQLAKAQLDGLRIKDSVGA